MSTDKHIGYSHHHEIKRYQHHQLKAELLPGLFLKMMKSYWMSGQSLAIVEVDSRLGYY